MDYYLVTFKYEGQLANSTAHDYVDDEIIKEVVTLLRAGGVAMTDWQPTHNMEIDHQPDFNGPILESHTEILVRLEVDDKAGTDDAIDWHDGGDDLFHYVLDAFELGEPVITYFHTYQQDALQKSIIEIDIHSAY